MRNFISRCGRCNILLQSEGRPLVVLKTDFCSMCKADNEKIRLAKLDKSLNDLKVIK